MTKNGGASVFAIGPLPKTRGTIYVEKVCVLRHLVLAGEGTTTEVEVADDQDTTTPEVVAGA